MGTPCAVLPHPMSTTPAPASSSVTPSIVAGVQGLGLDNPFADLLSSVSHVHTSAAAAALFTDESILENGVDSQHSS